MLWLILFGRTLQVSAHFKLKLAVAVAVAVAVLDFGLGGDKSDGAFCQSIRDELRGAFYNCGPALIRARARQALGVQLQKRADPGYYSKVQ